MKRAASALLAGGLVIALGACGGGTAIDAKGAELLQAEVAAARSAAARGDTAQAADLLQTVENTVNALRRQDKVTTSRAAEIIASVGKVRSALRVGVPTPAVTTPITTVTFPPATVAPTPDDGQKPDHKPRGKGHDKRERDD